MQILLANPRGFCAGVDRAIDIVERALELFGSPVYVRHEVVHNHHVVERLRGLGAVFVEELDQVPAGANVIFSAHGVSRAVVDAAAKRGLTVFDATCPLVTKVHMEVQRYANEGRDVILIGHAGHPEVEGTMGRFIWCKASPMSRRSPCAIRSASPLSLKRRFRWMTRHRSWPLCARALRTWRRRGMKTSATRRRTGRTR
jgi:(E)-4-hydroxy-3-methyl-but-2-enyl pyrophosphate reductase